MDFKSILNFLIQRNLHEDMFDAVVEGCKDKSKEQINYG